MSNNHIQLNNCAKEVLERIEYIKTSATFYSTYKTDNDSDLLKAERVFISELKQLLDITSRCLG